MENRIDTIFARQSVDSKVSFTIERQIELYKCELRGGDYKGKGFFGKNMDLPVSRNRWPTLSGQPEVF